MKNKIFNGLGFIIIIYGLSFLFSLLESMLDVSNVFVIFIIKPMPYFIAIYMYLGNEELKHDSEVAKRAYDTDLADKDKQIEKHETMDNSRRLIIDAKQEEIDGLKRELASVARDIKSYNALKKTVKSLSKGNFITVTNNADNEIPNGTVGYVEPFNSDNDTTEELQICECGSEMRECPTMWICKDLLCKKRRKKDVV